MPKFGLGTRSNTRRQFAGEVHDVLAAGPVGLVKEHGAVFDGNENALVLGDLHDGVPNGSHLVEVLLERLICHAPDKARHLGYAELLGGVDHVDQMLVADTATLKVGIHIIGVIGQRAYLHVMLGGIVKQVLRVCVVFEHTLGVHMGYACVATLGFTLRPRGDLDGLIANAAHLVDHFLKGPSVKDGGDNSQFHALPCFTLTTVPVLLDSMLPKTARIAARTLSPEMAGSVSFSRQSTKASMTPDAVWLSFV